MAVGRHRRRIVGKRNLAVAFLEHAGASDTAASFSGQSATLRLHGVNFSHKDMFMSFWINQQLCA
jgi:hypothetical protein